VGNDGRPLLLDLRLGLDSFPLLVLLVLLAEKSAKDAGTLVTGY
jgi:hypothetical protein